jgi:hypothetical protein
MGFFYLLCCLVLNPQMTGLATFPGEETVKESTLQSPIAFAKK